MEKSNVFVSMRDENRINCSYAIIEKLRHHTSYKVIIIVKDTEVAIFDYSIFNNPDKFTFDYLLLKHHLNDRTAYNDFLKLIGKMCKKDVASKYFANHINEDNRILAFDVEHEVGSDQYKETVDEYNKRLHAFRCFVHDCDKDKLFLYRD